MLTGENGILSQAQKAGEQTDIGKEKEDISLAYNGAKAENNGGDVDYEDLNRNFGYNNTDATAEGSNPITVTFDSGRQYTIDENGVISDPIEVNIVASIRIEGEKVTTPPMPSSDFSYVEGTVDDGYVIEDGKGNQYVWVPVDKNQKIKVNVTSKEEITSITLTDPYGDTTTLAENNIGTTYTNDNITPTINGPYVLKVKTANEEKTTMLGVHSLYAQDTFMDWMLNEEYAEIKGTTLENLLGGSTAEEVYKQQGQIFKSDYSDTEHYENSVNENGGFYIGRYEASYENGKPASKPSQKTDDTDEHIVTENGMLWNNISPTDALAKAKGMYTSVEFTSSLLTGSAWDRTLGWLEETGAVSSIEIVGDSKTWGNYSDDEFENSEGLQNTGSIPQTEKNHIFDLAGNVEEWTTEATSSAYRVIRGGNYYGTGSDGPCSYRYSASPDNTNSCIGFRLALYL